MSLSEQELKYARDQLLPAIDKATSQAAFAYCRGDAAKHAHFKELASFLNADLGETMESLKAFDKPDPDDPRGDALPA